MNSTALPLYSLTKEITCFSLILFFVFLLLLHYEQAYIHGQVVENNPFYGMSSAKISSVDSITNDSLINVKLEYSPNLVEPSSPEFFKVTLTYNATNQIVKHADSDIVISKDGLELYKASDEFSVPIVHTPNGLVLTSYSFQEPGQYTFSVNIVGIYFNPVTPKQVNFTVNVSESNDKYLIDISA
jgi:hypothetical protein